MTFLTTDIVAWGSGFDDFSDLIYLVLVVLLPALAGLGKWLRRRFGTKDEAEKVSSPKAAEKVSQRATVPKPQRLPPTVVQQPPPPSAKPVSGRTPQTHPRQRVPGIRGADTMAGTAQPVDLERPKPQRPEHLQPSHVRALSPQHLPRRQVPSARGAEPPHAVPQPPWQGAIRIPQPGEHRAPSEKPAKRRPGKARPVRRATPAKPRTESKSIGLLQSIPKAATEETSGGVPLIPEELTAAHLRSIVILSEVFRPPLALRSMDDWAG